jgi:lipopolysaccharide/colanic/teichoic acid biosynthesis glycosyltransferase
LTALPGLDSFHDVDWKVKVVKRAMDITIAGTGLLVGAPVFGAVAAAVKLTSKGPIFYTQVRAGAVQDAMSDAISNVPTFKMYKFRSMKTDAEKGVGAVLAAKGDTRVTPIGAFLRRTRLDELPQLINVIKGDMSIVGPRPERPEILGNLSMAIPFFEERMRMVKPGITGLAQVELSYTGEMAQGSELRKYADQLLNPFKMEGAEGALADDMRTKLLYDFAYCVRMEDFRTFLETDLSIIFRTPLVMILGKGR